MSGLGSEPLPDTDEESPSGDEDIRNEFLRVSPIQIGDLVFISRLLYASSESKLSNEMFPSEEEKSLIRFTLTAEGTADDKVEGVVADEWLQNPHQCLFRIETPATVSDSDEQNSVEAKLETRANKASFEKSQGRLLKYGQEVQLRHIHSNSLLSLNVLAAANKPGAWRISVNPPSDFLCRQICLLPFNRSHNIGDAIKSGESASIVFQRDNLKYYLQSEKIRTDLLDINSTHKPASWKFLKFQSHKETHVDAIKFGEMITIKYSKLSMFLALETPKAASEDARKPIVTKAEVKDYSNFWILQNIQILEGGCVDWDSSFHIKNVLTGFFLDSNLTLQPKPDPNSYFYFPKPESFIEGSTVPNGHPLIIKSNWDRILSTDSRETNEEALDHLVPFSELEVTAESGENRVIMQKLGLDQRESLFELDYVKPAEGAFFSQILGLCPKFRDTKEMLEVFGAEERHSWEAVETLEKRLGMMLSALENITLSVREVAGEELESKQKMFTGLDFHTVLIEVAYMLETLFPRDDNLAESGITELLISHARHNLAAIWDLLNDIVLDNLAAAEKVAEHQVRLCALLHYDTRRIGLLLTEVFRLFDPEIKDPKEFYHQWCSRLTRLSKANIQEQIIYLRIIRNLCEIGDVGVLEYQKEITHYLFTSEIAIDLLVFSEQSGEVAIHFGENGAVVSTEAFKQLNPDLSPFLQEDGQILLRDLSTLPTYIDYVQTALMLYHAVCRGRNFQAREHLEQRVHFGVRLALAVSQDLNVHIDIRQAGLFLLEALCISVPPFEAYSDSETYFNYAEIKLRKMKEDISSKQLIDYSARNADINICLELLFRLWMSKELPPAVQSLDLHSSMKYLLSALRLTLSIVEYKHATELWAQCVLKAVQYVLAGFTLAAATYSGSHWGAALVAQAVKAGESQRRVKIIVSEILNCVLNVLIAIKQVSRRHGLEQTISLFIAESHTLRNPLLGTDLKHLSPAFEAQLRFLSNSDRGHQLIENYFKQTTKAEKQEKGGKRKSIFEPLLSENRIVGSDFRPAFDFKEVLTNSPPLHDLFIRVILEWPSFTSQLKNKLIDVMSEVFQGNRLFAKALRASDVISLGPLSHVFNRLRWLKDNMELNSLCVRAKYEFSVTEKSASLEQIIHLLEYLTDFCHAGNGSSDFVIKKTQNILRQLEIHKDVSVVWQVVHCLERMGRARKTASLRLKSAIISFYLYFTTNNPANTKEIAKLLVPSMLSSDVLQFASLLRLLNDFSHLQISEITRIFVYILDEKQAEDGKDMNSMAIFEKMMLDRSGMLNKNVQNVASSLLSEKIAAGIEEIREKPLYMASLIENLALAAEDNPPVIAQCRHLLPLSGLQALLTADTHPLLMRAFTYFLYTVYIKKSTEANYQLKTLQSLTDVADFLHLILQFATPALQSTLDLLPLVVEGAYPLVYFQSSPAFSEIQVNVRSERTALHTWSALCSVRDGRLTGVFRTVPDILDSVDLDACLGPALCDFYYALVGCRAKVERMEEQTRDLLCFTPLLSVLQETATRIKQAVDLLRVEISEEHLTLVQGDSYPIPESLMEELRLALKGVLPFLADPLSKGHLEDDQNMSTVLKTGCQLLPKVCIPESEDAYINEIVALIDTRLSHAHKMTSKKDIKDLIASLVRKLRGLQRLFTSSKQRVLFFKILEGIVPNEGNVKFKLALNPLFQELRLMDYAVTAVLRNEGHEEVMAALSFLIKLLSMQSQDFLEKFRLGINENSSAYSLFMKIQTELGNGKALILEHAQAEKSRKSSAVWEILKAKKPALSAKAIKQQKLLVRLLNFMQICCANCNASFQVFYREQKNKEGKADVDLVSALTGFLIDIRPANDFLFSNETAFETLSAALSALVELVNGPCESNQKVLGNSVRVYLVLNQLIEASQGKPRPAFTEIHRNSLRFLSCLLEGHPDHSIPETMSQFLRLDLLRQGCERIYQHFVRGQEEAISLELTSLVPEHKGVVQAALLQAQLLLRLKLEGVMHDELSKFEQQYDDPKHCYGYFSKYIGYVEIERNLQLEKHLFPIPWKCKYLTASTRHTLIVDVNRSTQKEKANNFLNEIPNCELEMTHQQFLWRSNTFKSLSLHWLLWTQGSLTPRKLVLTGIFLGKSLSM